MFQDSRGGIHSVPLRFLRNARSVDPDLVVLATSPEQWQQFVGEQLGVDQQWNLRQEFTAADRELLKAMGIAWNEPSLEDFVCKILDSAIEDQTAETIAQEGVRNRNFDF
jgi:hypothetical protein